MTVRWFSSRPEILDWEGRHGENIREDGEAVTLTAIIGLQGQERNESWDILVFPEISDEKRQVEDMVEKANADTEKRFRVDAASENLAWRKVGMEKSRRWHAVRSSPAGIRPSGYGTSA